jgi:hypothetical protein
MIAPLWVVPGSCALLPLGGAQGFVLFAALDDDDLNPDVFPGAWPTAIGASAGPGRLGLADSIGQQAAAAWFVAGTELAFQGGNSPRGHR